VPSFGEIRFEHAPGDAVARVTLSHPGKQNAISVAMWRALRERFQALQSLPPEEAPRVVVVAGDGGHFAAGADIEEFPAFRFEQSSLRHYHDAVIAPALHAVLACDIPVVARIEGSCVGGGLEIASCCDLRLAAAGARFGAPIGRLGFPMAPGELQAIARVAAPATLRELLLEGRLLDAETAVQRGLLHRVLPDAAALDAEVQATIDRIGALAPHAARINKQTLRHLAAGTLGEAERHAHFGYATHPVHREGVEAFLARRTPRF
jgi:enoyl-CoA hydratase/carnithine racemase